ncbi:MAG: hypothetical protein JXB47_16645 [Anaerolineae bacterium]|nr:hypothetical protein [Anaerolineae bacterium]
MSTDRLYIDEYEEYEELYNPIRYDRKARRQRKPKAKHAPKKSDRAVIEALADDTAGLEGGFETTYEPSKYEAEWLLQSLRPFYDQAFITDVLALVKGGKEASVYRCAAEPVTTDGAVFAAAKVYRPHMFRQLRNDHVYRQGREVLTPNGRPVGKDADRVARALGKKTSYGLQVAHTSWLMYEYMTLQSLYQAGAAVPRPFAAGENAILMGYIGDERMPAPTLNEIDLEPEEAGALFKETLRNIEIMLQHNLAHGDLSAYNILYWEGEITLIDFPQVIDMRANPDAYTILQRDVVRTCEYFARQGVRCNPGDIMEDLWYRYGVDVA